MSFHRGALLYFGDNLLLLDDLACALELAGLDSASMGRELLLRASEAPKLERIAKYGTDRAGYPGDRRWRHDPSIPHEQVILATTPAENREGEAEPGRSTSLKKFDLTDEPLLLVYERAGFEPLRAKEYRFRAPEERRASLLALFEITKLELPEGWFRAEEGRAYRAWAEAATRGPDARGQLVEVGCWLGRSTSYLANLCRLRGLALTCVDHWQGSSDRFDPGYRERLATLDVAACFADHLARFELAPPARVLSMASVDAARAVEPASLDFVFLDGSHDEAAVRADLAAWSPQVRPGGTLAGHDYDPRHPGVVGAVDAFARDRGLEIVRGPGSLWRLGGPS